jgi:hypothetical protein
VSSNKVHLKLSVEYDRVNHRNTLVTALKSFRIVEQDIISQSTQRDRQYSELK